MFGLRRQNATLTLQGWPSQLFIMLHKFDGKGSINNKEVCLCINQFTVALQQQVANYISLLWHKPISLYSVGDTFSEKNKWKNLASANIKKSTGRNIGVHSRNHPSRRKAITVTYYECGFVALVFRMQCT